MGKDAEKLLELLRVVLAVEIAIILLWLLYSYIFLWNNTPNLVQLLKLDV